MKKLFLLLLTSAIASSLFSQETTQQLDKLIEAYARSGKFNGSILVAQNGKILLEKGYGFKNAKSNVLNDANTIYQIGSITKPFTSMVILKLVELKQLSLTDKLSKYYPELPNADSISIENLLTHTSGIYNYTRDGGFMNTEAIKPATEQKILALFKNKKLDFSPGTNWSYSNSGYSLLGYIIQKATKMPYEKAVRHYIFTPLKMQSSGFDFTHLTSKDKATGYFTLTEKYKAEAPIVDSSVSFSAGAIYSTVNDLYKWHRALQANQITNKTLLEKAYIPFKNNYGYGWVIDSIFGKRIVSHSGGIFGFNSNLARIPEDDVCIVLLNNMGNFNLETITKNILAILYNQPYNFPVEKKEISLNEEALKKYIGVYEMPGFVIEITVENGKLMAQPSGQSKEELFAQKENYFFSKNVEVDVEFKADETGKIGQLFITQAGRTISGRKIK